MVDLVPYDEQTITDDAWCTVLSIQMTEGRSTTAVAVCWSCGAPATTKAQWDGHTESACDRHGGPYGEGRGDG